MSPELYERAERVRALAALAERRRQTATAPVIVWRCPQCYGVFVEHGEGQHDGFTGPAPAGGTTSIPECAIYPCDSVAMERIADVARDRFVALIIDRARP